MCVYVARYNCRTFLPVYIVDTMHQCMFTGIILLLEYNPQRRANDDSSHEKYILPAQFLLQFSYGKSVKLRNKQRVKVLVVCIFTLHVANRVKKKKTMLKLTRLLCPRTTAER
jgi:hypothetical protein